MFKDMRNVYDSVTAFTDVLLPVSTDSSEEFFLNGYLLIGVIVPSDWTDASISFDVSVDKENFYHLFDDVGDEVTVSVSAGKAYSIEMSKSALLLPWTWVRIRSGIEGAYVNQTGSDKLLQLARRLI